MTRIWQYQKERFPIFKTSILTFLFSISTMVVSASLADRGLPSIWNFIAIWLSVLLIFFQMRVFDEIKDYESDAKYRPERAVPRGLVTLKELKWFALAAALIITILTGSLSPLNLLPLALLWGWLFLMTFEFFVPHWLKAHPFVYLISHMAIMPLIDLYVSSGEWMRAANAPPSGLWVFLALSLINGCVLEFGRKIWAPENEREGVESYSKLLGYQKSVMVWFGFIIAAFLLLLTVTVLLDSWAWVVLPALILVLYIGKLARDFARNPIPKLQKKIDDASGIWVSLCYGLAGLPPLLMLILDAEF